MADAPTHLSMAGRYRRPDWVRRLNAMADAVGDPIEGARRLIPLDPDALVAGALESLGGGSLPDFGDPEWRTSFDALTRAADGAPFNLLGRLLTRQELLRALRSRLLLGRSLAADPGIADESIRAPLIVTGPARSGTTILFELLALDPSLRAPLAYEALHPVPLTAGGGDDPRIALSECEQELWADIQPEFAAIHELRSDLPVECVTLCAPSFCGAHWAMVTPAPIPMDISRDYAFHRRILQGLQRSADARTWLLKTPAHLATLDTLFASYPDAWVIQTHRDPAKTMPSTVSTTAMVQWIRSDHVDVSSLALAIEMAFGGVLNQVAERRAKGDLPERFVDVHFRNLLDDPVASVRAAYAAMQRDFGPEHAERITRYLAEKPRGKFGVHQYSAADWGFDAAELRERLAPYIRHFDVALEDA